MNYRVLSYLTFKGLIDFIRLPDSAYGEWIISERNIPRYYINIFSNDSESNLKIKHLLDSKKESINSIIDKLSSANSVNLSISEKPTFGIMIKSALKNIQLNPIPENWIKNLN